MNIIDVNNIKIPTTSKKYCNSLFTYSRFITREVNIGNVPLGGKNPIRIQSMTTTDTMDTQATVEQTIRIIDAGADYVRITAPSINEAKNLESIKKELRKRGYNTPLIADIHFTPNAAELAARIVEKVRINPGNYADKKKFAVINYTPETYENELERIRLKFTPLIKICKEYGTAIRIGTNHGSLSDRIMSRYGDTPLGMVESALEFVRICEDLNFFNIVLSMKSSNPKVMVEAYRLLINKMIDEKMNYPIHLGVTEAGDGEDGRIKSSIGIGTLLEDGIGDTIRVSLTEEPEFEIPVAKKLAERYKRQEKIQNNSEQKNFENYENPIDPFNYNRRITYEVNKIGLNNAPIVIVSPNISEISEPEGLAKIGYEYNSILDKWNINDISPDFIYLGNNDISYPLPGTLKKIFNYKYWLTIADNYDSFPLFMADEYITATEYSNKINFIVLKNEDLANDFLIDKISTDKTCVLILDTKSENAMSDLRLMFFELINKKLSTPAVIHQRYSHLPDEEIILFSATDIGGLLVDGLGDGVWFEAENNIEIVNRTSFGILQATRTRISKTEYISCPSCGRTLFNLQETTAKIRQRTDHLKGIKIGIMGCIVNGPGEMADADYGYVGSGPGKITLYKGKEVIKRNVDAEVAVDELIELIKINNDWVEK